MNIQEFISKWKFVESEYYKVINGEVFRNVQAGLIKEDDFRKTTRHIGKYRIVARHFDCALPYTHYYLIFEDRIYETELYPIWIPNILLDMTNDLKIIMGGE